MPLSMHTLLAAETSSDKDARAHSLIGDTHHGQDRTFTDVNLLSGRAGTCPATQHAATRAPVLGISLSVARVPRDGISD